MQRSTYRIQWQRHPVIPTTGRQTPCDGSHLAKTIWVALNIGEVFHGLLAKLLLLLQAVGAPEGAIHLGSRLLQLLCQADALL